MKGFPKGFFIAAGKAISVFDSLDANWMFVGAVPVSVWGRVRATTDADFAISIDLSGAFDLDDKMVGAGFEKIEGPVEIPGKRLILSKYWHGGKAGLGIDVFFSTGYDVGRFLGSAMQRKVPVTFQRKRYWALSAEDLVIMKLLANRAKDVDDVAGVLEKMFGELDWPYIHDWCVELRIEQPLIQLVREFMEISKISGAFPWEGS
jgi:hypothetical protein